MLVKRNIVRMYYDGFFFFLPSPPAPSHTFLTLRASLLKPLFIQNRFVNRHFQIIPENMYDAIQIDHF